jgi:sulfate adenylyltransferase subunit 1
VKVQEILNVISTDFSGTYGVDELKLNEIGNVQIQLSKPLFADSYEDNKANGKFIIIDCQTNQTSGVGFVN